MAYVSYKLRLPRIVGMLVVGVILGPSILNLLDPSILLISADLRTLALVIILIKAGLSLRFSQLKSVGLPALLLSFVPASFEILACAIFGPWILGLDRAESLLLGAVLGAVSPAVVVPKMTMLIEEKRGTDKNIPQMILAASSLDDVFVIVLFTSFLSLVQGNGVSLISLLAVPESILTGSAAGMFVGYLLAKFLNWRTAIGKHIRASVRVIIILGISFLLLALEDLLAPYFGFSGLLAIMVGAMALRLYLKGDTAADLLTNKFGKLWLAAELLLFVLVGAAVDIKAAFNYGLAAFALIILALLVRSLGVMICLIRTPLNMKERLFCVISYIPKATVQAAIGGIPLSMGLPCGPLVLSVAVLSIVLTAPLGAWGMDATAPRLLHKEN